MSLSTIDGDLAANSLVRHTAHVDAGTGKPSVGGDGIAQTTTSVRPKFSQERLSSILLANQKIAVVLPAYNAARTLTRTVAEIDRTVVDDLILTDDSSRDETALLAESLGLHTIVHTANKGYGANQKTCYTAALARGADIVVMLHPDYQYSPKLVPAMAAMIISGHYDAVLASRILGGGALTGGMPIWKYVTNRGLTLIENILLGQKFSEYHSGFRAWSRQILETLPLERCSDDFVFDNQMIALAIHAGFKFGEISCPTRYFEGASSINFCRSVIYGFGVLDTAIRFRLDRCGLCRWGILEKIAD